MSDTTIRMMKLHKRYGMTDALVDLTLTIGPGVTALLGPNGAGKTTLMRILATVLAPTEGRLRLLGLDPADADQRTQLRRQLGYMPQEPGFNRHFTAFEFVDYVAILKEMTDTDARHREVRRVLTKVGLGDVAGRRIRKLSGGMRMRVARTAPRRPRFDGWTTGQSAHRRALRSLRVKRSRCSGSMPPSVRRGRAAQDRPAGPARPPSA
jgi:ABC-2 type transport system ATP-binding protein